MRTIEELKCFLEVCKDTYKAGDISWEAINCDDAQSYLKGRYEALKMCLDYLEGKL